MPGTTISGAVTIGITLGSNGYISPLSITSTGTVQPLSAAINGTIGVYAGYAGGSVFNDGTIFGGDSASFSGAGISLSAGYMFNRGAIAGGAGGYFGGAGAAISGGTLTSTGNISGGYGAVSGGAGVTISNGTIVNHGDIVGGNGGFATDFLGFEGIAGEAGYGAAISDGLMINTGAIIGGRPGTGRGGYGDGGDAVHLIGGTLENTGALIGGTTGDNVFGNSAGSGIYLGGGTLVNSGTIMGNYGSYLGGFGLTLGGGTLIDSGTIVGGLNADGDRRAAVTLVGTTPDNFTVNPGAIFNGDVIGTGDNAINLGAASAGTTGTLAMDGTFSGFDTIAFDRNASWYISGTKAELATNDMITGFTNLDTIMLDGFTATSKNYVTGTGLELTSAAGTETLDITGSFDTASFQIIDEAQGTEILLCFLRGTRILGPAGEVAVEALNIGDTVITRFGGYQRIKWIGRQSFGAPFIRNNRSRLPVRIQAGALGRFLPKRDLYISPGHSMLIGRILVLARSLVNGVTITQDAADEDVHYYLLEFESHDCVLAEGSWSESFADAPGLRNQFHNVSEFHALYPEFTPTPELRLCAPRPETGRLLEAAMRPIVAAATRAPCGALRGSIDMVTANGYIEGWAQDAAYPLLPVLLEILWRNHLLGTVLACDLRVDLAEAGIGNGNCAFSIQLPAPFPVPLREIRMRRAADGAEIYQTQACLARAA